jgi:hypothetical protein
MVVPRNFRRVRSKHEVRFVGVSDMTGVNGRQAGVYGSPQLDLSILKAGTPLHPQ